MDAIQYLDDATESFDQFYPNRRLLRAEVIKSHW